MERWMDGNHTVNNQCINLNLVNMEYIETKEVLHNSLLWQGDIKFNIKRLKNYVILSFYRPLGLPMVLHTATFLNIWSLHFVQFLCVSMWFLRRKTVYLYCVQRLCKTSWCSRGHTSHPPSWHTNFCHISPVQSTNSHWK